jgi:CBS domain-containing protein
MQVRELMKRNLESILRVASIRNAAEKMRALDVGMLPVQENGEVVGTVTDRDITIRATAAGADPNATSVGDVMSTAIFTCVEDDDLLQAARIMEEHQIRRLMVQDAGGHFVGMLSLADLARRRETENVSAEVLAEVSRPPPMAGSAH